MVRSTGRTRPPGRAAPARTGALSATTRRDLAAIADATERAGLLAAAIEEDARNLFWFDIDDLVSLIRRALVFQRDGSSALHALAGTMAENLARQGRLLRDAVRDLAELGRRVERLERQSGERAETIERQAEIIGELRRALDRATQEQAPRSYA